MSDKRLHPGPRHPMRRFYSQPAKPCHLRAELRAGKSLHDAVFDVLGKNDLKSASMTLIGGSFSKFEFTTGDIETRPDSDKQANFTFIRQWDSCYMFYGSATAGVSVEDKPLLHCHAVFANQNDVQYGGHLFPEKCMIAECIIAHIIAHPHVRIRQFFDEETTHSVFNPVIDGAPHVF